MRTNLIAVARSDSTCQVVLVAARHRGHLNVALCHTVPELATPTDVVVPAGAGPVPYPLVIQTDLVGPVLPHQLTRDLGPLPASWRALVSDVSVDGNPDFIRLAGPADRRWSHKAEQGEALSALTAPALRVLLP